MSTTKKSVRVYIDGCYDLLHFGHANAIRQASLMGDVLVAGLVQEDQIIKRKGPPVLTTEERRKLLKSVKWVDEVIEDVNYDTTTSDLDRWGCELATHGDDLIMAPDGTDPYKPLADVGRFKIYKRTRGVSTTDIVGRMLTITEDKTDIRSAGDGDELDQSQYTLSCDFMATAQKIAQFSNTKEPKTGDRIIYVDGAFDVFNVGHVDFLERVSKEGDYIIVGLHTDDDVKRCKGEHYPIMNVHERTLSVLACRYVSDVVIDAPYTVTEEFMEYFDIDMVIHGLLSSVPAADGSDPYAYPKSVGVYKQVDSKSTFTTSTLVERVREHRDKYLQRNNAKINKDIKNGIFSLKKSSSITGR